MRRAHRALEILARREREACACYEPLPVSLKFHQSQASERLLVGSNQSSKTTSAVRDFAWAITGTHPYVPYPKTKGKFYAVGINFDHVKEVMWKKLAREGAIRIIRDEFTRVWRPVYPDNPYDAASKEKWRDAGPFLPERQIADIAWNSKNEDIPEVVRLKNGSVVNWYSSLGAPQQGSQIDGWWFDEEIGNDRWLPEMEARCIARNGRGVWSCTPEHSTRQLYEMHQRATSRPKTFDVDAFFMSLKDNAHLSQKQKDDFRQKLRTEHEVRTKYFGEFAVAGLLVYPEYTTDNHVIKSFDIPLDWSRHMIVDPGVQVCAVLFAAVPPPGSQWEGERHIYDELYIHRCSASIFATDVARKMGHFANGGFETFVIDHRMGRQTQMIGSTVEEQYGEALKKQNVWSRSTQNGFYWGNDDVRAREERLRRWIEHNPGTGKPTLRIHDRCQCLDWELKQQFYRKDPKGPATDKREDRNNHAVSCLEYFADFDPPWVKPKKPQVLSPVAKFMRKKRKDKSGNDYISLGPPTAKGKA